MVFGRKKKTEKATKKKGKTKTFIDGKQDVSDEVPDKVPELEVPTPPPEEKTEPEQKPMSAQEIYDEGVSVGFQKGMIHSIELLNVNLQSHQAELRRKIEEQKR